MPGSPAPGKRGAGLAPNSISVSAQKARPAPISRGVNDLDDVVDDPLIDVQLAMCRRVSRICRGVATRIDRDRVPAAILLRISFSSLARG